MPAMASSCVPSSGSKVKKPELIHPDEILSLTAAFKALPRLDGSPSAQKTIAIAHQIIHRLANDIEVWQSINPSKESWYQQQIQALTELNASQQQQIEELTGLNANSNEMLQRVIRQDEAHHGEVGELSVYKKKCKIQEGVITALEKNYKVLDMENRDLDIALAAREKANADLRKQVGLLEHKNDLLQQIIDRLDKNFMAANESLKQLERRAALQARKPQPQLDEPLPIDPPSELDRDPDPTALQAIVTPHEELSSLKVKNLKLKRENGALQQEVKVLKKLLKEAKGR